MNFEEELTKGNFTIPECSSCKKIVWPPAEFCDVCYNETCLKSGQFTGKIIEFSENLPIKKEGFLIGEFLGMIKIQKNVVEVLRKTLGSLRKTHEGEFHDAESFQVAKITDMLQELIELDVEINPVFVKGKCSFGS